MNYDIVNGQYASPVNMNASLSQAGFQVKNEIQVLDEQLETLTSIEKTPFKDLFEEYANIRSNNNIYNLGIFRASRIEIEKPLVKEAYDVLGPAKVRELNYHQSNIRKEMIKRKDETLFTKAFLLIDGQLPKQVAIPKTVIKQKLAERSHASALYLPRSRQVSKQPCNAVHAVFGVQIHPSRLI